MRGHLVRIIAATSVFACLLWVIGLGWALADYFEGTGTSISKNPASKNITNQTKEDKGLNVMALGDSLTRGTGDKDGKGYVGYLADQLHDKSKKKIHVYNFGLNGMTSAQLVEALNQIEVQRQARSADLILITIGGNDLFQGGQALFELDVTKIQASGDAYLKNLDIIFSKLRALNPKASIFMVGLYNPFSEQADADLTSKAVRDWNYRTSEITAKYPGVVLVPTFDLFQLKVDKYLSPDKFHPNAEGYKLIAGRIAELAP